MNITCLVKGHQYPYIIGERTSAFRPIRCYRCGHVQRAEPPARIVRISKEYSPAEYAAFRAGWNAALDDDDDDPRDWGRHGA